MLTIIKKKNFKTFWVDFRGTFCRSVGAQKMKKIYRWPKKWNLVYSACYH